MMHPGYTRRDFLRLSALAGTGVLLSGGLGTLLAACGGGGGGSGPGPLNFLTWSDHFSADLLKAVKEQKGIDVKTSELSDNSDGLTKLRNVKGQLDLVSADALWVPKYLDEDLIEPIDINSFEVAKELYPLAREFSFWKTDKGGGYMAYPFGWSPIQIVYNPKYVQPAPDSWQVLIDPKYAGKVQLENQPTDIMLFAAIATGAKDPYNMTDAELAVAKDWLSKLKPNVRKLVAQNSENIQAMANEEIWLCTQNLGAPARIKDAGGPDTVAFVPKEGTAGFIDGEMTVKGGENHDRVRPYLEFAEQAEWIAQNFLDNGRPLFNEKAYRLLVDKGYKERADLYLYNQPEVALKMTLKGPGGRTEDYIKTFNEVFGA
jgi:spermidine/putrescine-binding protein